VIIKNDGAAASENNEEFEVMMGAWVPLMPNVSIKPSFIAFALNYTIWIIKKHLTTDAALPYV
jgi:hypothetical protein